MSKKKKENLVYFNIIFQIIFFYLISFSFFLFLCNKWLILNNKLKNVLQKTKKKKIKKSNSNENKPEKNETKQNRNRNKLGIRL